VAPPPLAGQPPEPIKEDDRPLAGFRGEKREFLERGRVKREKGNEKMKEKGSCTLYI